MSYKFLQPHDDVMRFRVSLDDVTPDVWRTFDVRANTLLPHLSRVILAAMGWREMHLHQFRVGRIAFSIPDHDDPDPYRYIDEARTYVASVFHKPGDTCSYVYDFGDHWQHTVELLDFFARDEGAKYPRLIDGANACPPEDFGGPWRYAECVASGELPRGFDPTAFDVEKAAKRVARISTRTHLGR